MHGTYITEVMCLNAVETSYFFWAFFATMSLRKSCFMTFITIISFLTKTDKAKSLNSRMRGHNGKYHTSSNVFSGQPSDKPFFFRFCKDGDVRINRR